MLIPSYLISIGFIRTSLLSRLGDKLETTTTPEAMEFTEEEIWAEMMRQKNKKLKKKIKKEEKRVRKNNLVNRILYYTYSSWLYLIFMYDRRFTFQNFYIF